MIYHMLEIVVKKGNVIIRKSSKRAGSEKIAKQVFHVEHDRLTQMQVDQHMEEIKIARKRGFYDVYLRYVFLRETKNGKKVAERFDEQHFTFANDQKFGRIDDVSKAK